MLAVAGLALLSSVSRGRHSLRRPGNHERSLALYGLSGARCSAYSNEISVSVLSVYGPVVTPDGTISAPGAVARAFAGETVAFAFRLRNAGTRRIRSACASRIPRLRISFPSRPDSTSTPMGTASSIRAKRLSPRSDRSRRRRGAARAPGRASLRLGGGETAHVNLVARSQADTSSWDGDNVVRIVARRRGRDRARARGGQDRGAAGRHDRFRAPFRQRGRTGCRGRYALGAVDLSGAAEGTDYVAGSASSTVAGRIEYYDAAASSWVGIPPPVDRIKGIRLLAGSLDAGARGTCRSACA